MNEPQAQKKEQIVLSLHHLTVWCAVSCIQESNWLWLHTCVFSAYVILQKFKKWEKLLTMGGMATLLLRPVIQRKESNCIMRL